MHRRKSLSVEETEERLAFALAGDGPRQAAHDFVASKLSDAGFRDKLDRYKQMIEQDDADLRDVYSRLVAWSRRTSRRRSLSTGCRASTRSI